MINKKMYELGSKSSIIREIFEYSKVRSKQIGEENVFNFSLGNPSVEPPKIVNQTIKEILDNENSTLVHGYTSGAGDMTTRDIIAKSITKRFGCEIDSNHIYMTCGAAASLTISLKAIMNEGDECIVFAPFFTEYRVFVHNANGELVVSSPDPKTFQIDIEDFKRKITNKTKCIIINSPNNPSGVVYSEDTIKEICKILKSLDHTVYIICDEPYRELVYGGIDVPYLMNYYDNTLVCYSYSKALSLPGERIGYIAVNHKAENSKDLFFAVCGAGRSLGYVCAPSLFQQVIGRINGATVDVNIYKENRDILLDNLTKFGYHCVKPDGAFYLFISTFNIDAYKFCEIAKKYEILVVPCDDFGVKNYVRLAYCVDKSMIERSLPSFYKLAKECINESNNI